MDKADNIDLVGLNVNGRLDSSEDGPKAGSVRGHPTKPELAAPERGHGTDMKWN